MITSIVCLAMVLVVVVVENAFATKIVLESNVNAILYSAVNQKIPLRYSKYYLGMNGKCGNGKCIHEIDPKTGSCKMSCDCEPGKFIIQSYLHHP